MEKLRNKAHPGKRGVVMVITGDGKGKTTAALGQALRAIGHESRVVMIQFLKGRPTGEVMAAKYYLPGLDILQFGRDAFVQPGKIQTEDIDMACSGLRKAQEFIAADRYDMIILDEVIMAVDLHLLSEEDVMRLIEQRPSHMDVIMTGRNASENIIERADIVSEIRQIKHHFESGIRARAGIEY